MRNPLRRLVDHRAENSLAASFRRRRFELFIMLVAHLPRPVRILDLGGEQCFWELMGLAGNADYQVVILNLAPPETTLPNLRGVTGDAANPLPFADQEFEMVFSNSLIEHLGTPERQQRIAAEVRRVGCGYFIQTPSKTFPLEPHFLVPFFQYFPSSLQVALLQRFDLGWYCKIPDQSNASQHIRSHRLLTEAEMRRLFPDGELYKERVFGLTKSFVAYRKPAAKVHM